MTLRRGLVPLLLALAVGAAPAATAGQDSGPGAGAAGIGDAYFPRDGNGGIDVLHYDIHDRYDLGSGRLDGRTRLALRALEPLSRFDLDFLLDVRSVTVDGRRARFRQSGDHELRITPRHELAAGQRYDVVVRYAGRPARAVSNGESNWLASGSEVVAMNEPHMATWWFPANDHPLDKASFDIHISVPRGVDVVANGVRVATRRRGSWTSSHWRASEPMAPYLAFFAAGSFETRASRCRGTSSLVAVSRERPPAAPSVDADALAQKTCDAVTAYEKVLGSYPFSTVGGLVTGLPVPFALENQTRPTYPASSGPSQSLVAHEIAHQWFGDSVSVSGWRDIWLNEGFAQYLETYYMTEVLQGRSMQAWLGDTYDRRADDQTFWGLPIDDPGPEHLFDAPVYTRGAMALQALRHRVGDPAFWALLRTWLGQRAYGNGSVADFEALAAAVSGQDLGAFFTTWLHAGQPPARNADNGF